MKRKHNTKEETVCKVVGCIKLTTIHTGLPTSRQRGSRIEVSNYSKLSSLLLYLYISILRTRAGYHGEKIDPIDNMDDRIIVNTTSATTIATLTTLTSSGTPHHYHPIVLLVLCVSLLLVILISMLYLRRRSHEQREQARRRNDYVELLHNTHGYRIYTSPGRGTEQNYWEQPDDDEQQYHSRDHHTDNQHQNNRHPFAVGGSMNVVIL